MKKRKKRGSVGALKDIPYEQIVGAIGGATVGAKIPKMLEKADIAFLKENPDMANNVLNAAKAGLGVWLSMMENKWVQGIGIGLAAESVSNFVGKQIDSMIGAIEPTVRQQNNLPPNANLPYSFDNPMIGANQNQNGLRNEYSFQEAFVGALQNSTDLDMY